MQSWIAQLLTVLVAFVVFVIIATTNLRVQQVSIATTQYQASSTNQTDFVGVMDRDFRNIGSRYPDYDLDPDSAIIAFDSTGVFAFWAQTERGAAPNSIRYEWGEVGTVRVDTGFVPAYSVSRTVDGQAAGGTAGAVTQFDLRLLDDEGHLTGILANVRQIDVDVNLVSSLGSNSLVETNGWQTIIRPSALSR